MLHRFSYFVATGFYSGLSPVSPGTAGSLACVALWVTGRHFTGYPNTVFDTSVLAILSLLIGVFTSHICVKELLSKAEEKKEGESKNHTDPGFIVIDEWAGMLIALCGVPAGSLGETFGSVAAAFVLFRIFDILKPPPVSTAERLPGAWGVMLDDVVAGGIALGVLYGLQGTGVL